jgi:hypothetical protein
MLTRDMTFQLKRYTSRLFGWLVINRQDESHEEHGSSSDTQLV